MFACPFFDAPKRDGQPYPATPCGSEGAFYGIVPHCATPRERRSAVSRIHGNEKAKIPEPGTESGFGGSVAPPDNSFRRNPATLRDRYRFNAPPAIADLSLRGSIRMKSGVSGRVCNTGRRETVAPDSTRIAFSTGPSVRIGAVTRHRQRVVDAKPRTGADDIGFAKLN